MNEEFRVYYSARIYSEMLRAMARRTVDIRSKLRFANRELGRIATELRYFKNEKETLRLIYADNKKLRLVVDALLKRNNGEIFLGKEEMQKAIPAFHEYYYESGDIHLWTRDKMMGDSTFRVPKDWWLLQRKK